MSNEKISIIRGSLKFICLSDEAIDKVIDFISDLLFEKDEKSTKIEFPYHQVDEFLSHAELNFFLNLKSVIGDSVQIFSKVRLGDLFYAKTGDFGKNRGYTNKINQKHIDFVLCDSKTLNHFSESNSMTRATNAPTDKNAMILSIMYSKQQNYL